MRAISSQWNTTSIVNDMSGQCRSSRSYQEALSQFRRRLDKDFCSTHYDLEKGPTRRALSPPSIRLWTGLSLIEHTIGHRRLVSAELFALGCCPEKRPAAAS
jgi:hypothetical protein